MAHRSASTSATWTSLLDRDAHGRQGACRAHPRQVAEEVRRLGGVGLATSSSATTPPPTSTSASSTRPRGEVGHRRAATSGSPARRARRSCSQRRGAERRRRRSTASSSSRRSRPQLDEARPSRRVDPAKDVDGLHPVNAGLLALGRPRLVGATPVGVMRAARRVRGPARGRERGRRRPQRHRRQAGRAAPAPRERDGDRLPLADEATSARETLEADILVAAVGVPTLIAADMVKRGATVIDVGHEPHRRRGSLATSTPASPSAPAYMTPVPGGVGPMTIAMLLRNTVRAARSGAGLLAYPRR